MSVILLASAHRPNSLNTEKHTKHSNSLPRNSRLDYSPGDKSQKSEKDPSTEALSARMPCALVTNKR